LDLLINETDAADKNAVNNLKAQLDEIDDLLEKDREDSDRKNEVARRIGEVIKETDKLTDLVQWPMAEQELNDALAQVARSQRQSGDDQTALAFAQMQEQAAEIKRKNDANSARLLTSKLWSLKSKVETLTAVHAIEDDIEKAQHSLTLLSWMTNILDVELIERLEQEVNGIRIFFEQERSNSVHINEVTRKTGILLKKLDQLHEQVRQ